MSRPIPYNAAVYVELKGLLRRRRTVEMWAVRAIWFAAGVVAAYAVFGVC